MRLPAASLTQKLFGILRDPPPEFVFEIAADGITVPAYPPSGYALQHVPLKPGVIAPSPVKGKYSRSGRVRRSGSKSDPARHGPKAQKRGPDTSRQLHSNRRARLRQLAPQRKKERRPLIQLPPAAERVCLSISTRPHFPTFGKLAKRSSSPSRRPRSWRTMRLHSARLDCIRG